MFRSQHTDNSVQNSNKENTLSVRRQAGTAGHATTLGPFKTPAKQVLNGKTPSKTGARTDFPLTLPPSTIKGKGAQLNTVEGSKLQVPRTPFAIKEAKTPGTRHTSKVQKFSLGPTTTTTKKVITRDVVQELPEEQLLNSLTKSTRGRHHPSPRTPAVVSEKPSISQDTSFQTQADTAEYDLEPEYMPPTAKSVPVEIDFDLPTFDPKELAYTADKPWDWNELLEYRNEDIPEMCSSEWLGSLCASQSQIEARRRKVESRIESVLAQKNSGRTLFEDLLGPPKFRTSKATSPQRTKSSLSTHSKQPTLGSKLASRSSRTETANYARPTTSASRKMEGNRIKDNTPIILPDWVGDECLGSPLNSDDDNEEEDFQFTIPDHSNQGAEAGVDVGTVSMERKLERQVTTIPQS